MSLENTGLFCDTRTVPESTIEQVLVTAINDTLSGKDTFLTTLQNNIATVLSRENDKILTAIDTRLEELQTQLLKLASSKADYEDVAYENTACANRSRRHSWKMQGGMNYANVLPI